MLNTFSSGVSLLDDFKIVSRHVIFWRAGKPSTKKYGGHSPWKWNSVVRDYEPDELCNSVKKLKPAPPFSASEVSTIGTHGMTNNRRLALAGLC
jgi:hypothetical protein